MPENTDNDDDTCLTHRERVTLLDYFEGKLKAIERLLCLKIGALEKQVMARLDSLDKATSLANNTMDRRLEGMNEFRAQLKDQAATFISRGDLDAYKALVDADLRVLRQANAKAEGKASQQSVNVALFISAAGLILGILSLALKIFGGG